jgi:hypothetical protein
MSDGQETGDAAGLFTAAEKIFDQPCGSAICLARIKHNSVGELVEAAVATAVRVSGPGEKPGWTKTAAATARQTSQAATTSRMPSDAGGR